MPGADREFEKDRKLFVGGLDYETTDSVLKEYFEQFGELTDWVVMKFPDTRRSRGFGFVTFKDPERLEDCLSAGPHRLDGATVELKRATPREDERRGGKGGRSGKGGRFDDDEENDPESLSMRKLFIGGLNYATTEEEMREHFEQFGTLEDCVVMKFSDSGRSRGFGFVTFTEASMLDCCQNNRPHNLGGKTLETKRATPRRDSGKPEAQMSVKKIFIGGLSDEMEDDDIRDYFIQFGAIMNVEQLKWNDTGKKRGFGFVEFDDYDPVDKIVLIGKHVLKNRRLEVKKALSKQEMSMMKKSESRDVWGGSGRDMRDMRGGEGSRDRRGRGRDDDRDDRRGGMGGGSRGGMGGGFGNMMGNMGDMMGNMQMQMMKQMMMASGMGGGMQGMGNMNMMRNAMMMGGMGGGGFDDDLPMGNRENNKGYSTGGGSGGSSMMSGGFGNDFGMGGGMGGFGNDFGGGWSGMSGGGPMRGMGGNQSGRDSSAPYTRRSMDRGDRGRRF